jgi:hypothetical protein
MVNKRFPQKCCKEVLTAPVGGPIVQFMEGNTMTYNDLMEAWKLVYFTEIHNEQPTVGARRKQQAVLARVKMHLLDEAAKAA